MDAYCLKCKQHTKVLHPHQDTSANGRRMLKGECAHGHKVCRILGMAGKGVSTVPVKTKVKEPGTAVGGAMPVRFLEIPSTAPARGKGFGFGVGRGLMPV